jgi:hypothetical protein
MNGTIRTMDRLRNVALGLGGVAHTAAVETVAPPLLRQNEDGSILAEDLDLLSQQEHDAATARNYRAAGILHDTLEALRPQPRLTIEDCSPTDVDEQHAFFLKHGFILIHNILHPEKIPRAQAAWTAAQDRAEASWHARKAAGDMERSTTLYFDLPNLMAEDDVFIDMIDSPALVPVMSRITGTPQALDPESSLRAAGCEFPSNNFLRFFENQTP